MYHMYHSFCTCRKHPLAIVGYRPSWFHIKISDFGLARRSDKLEFDSMIGTYPYLAPEVMKDGLISKVSSTPLAVVLKCLTCASVKCIYMIGNTFLQASDVYSFGVLLYEILCSKQAWGGLTSFQIYYQVVEKQKTLQWPEQIPESLKNVAIKCLEPDAAQRCTFAQIIFLLSEC